MLFKKNQRAQLLQVFITVSIALKTLALNGARDHLT
jgi:uncharacterized membrane protein YwzB